MISSSAPPAPVNIDFFPDSAMAQGNFSVLNVSLNPTVSEKIKRKKKGVLIKFLDFLEISSQGKIPLSLQQLGETDPLLVWPPAVSLGSYLGPEHFHLRESSPRPGTGFLWGCQFPASV